MKSLERAIGVFPAYAGVFLVSEFLLAFSWSLPRIRGGVSDLLYLLSCLMRSSPHTRGCFRVMRRRQDCVAVFPAYAGVFPEGEGMTPAEEGLPRIRGGVSGAIVYGAADIRSSPHTRGCFQLSD